MENNGSLRQGNGQFVNGHGGGPGRPKGAENRVTANLRQMIMGALDELGGQAFLVKYGTEHPTEFINLLGKMVPREMAFRGDAPLLGGGLLDEIKRRAFGVEISNSKCRIEAVEMDALEN